MNPAYSRYWTADRIIDAIRAWVAEHGEPPKALDWKRAAPAHPAHVTVAGIFGRWNAAIEAAGFVGRPSQAPGPWRAWDKALIAEAFLDFLLREGRWPTSTDCGQYRASGSRRVAGLPSWQTVYRRFGSWTAAKKFAGWDPNIRMASESCSGCGGELDGVTIGCKNCTDRRRHRLRREADRTGACSPVSQASARVAPAIPGAGPLPAAA